MILTQGYNHGYAICNVSAGHTECIWVSLRATYWVTAPLTNVCSLGVQSAREEALNNYRFALKMKILCSFSNKNTEEVMEFTFTCRWSEFL